MTRGGAIEKSIKRRSRESLMPPNLDKSIFDDLPEEQGIYYFVDKKGVPIYIGKSKNIKTRIVGHFTTGSTSRERIRFIDEIYGINTKLCANELITNLTECHEIKKHWPKHNREYKSDRRTMGFISISIHEVLPDFTSIRCYGSLNHYWSFPILLRLTNTLRSCRQNINYVQNSTGYRSQTMNVCFRKMGVANLLVDTL